MHRHVVNENSKRQPLIVNRVEKSFHSKSNQSQIVPAWVRCIGLQPRVADHDDSPPRPSPCRAREGARKGIEPPTRTPLSPIALFSCAPHCRLVVVLLRGWVKELSQNVSLFGGCPPFMPLESVPEPSLSCVLGLNRTIFFSLNALVHDNIGI